MPDSDGARSGDRRSQVRITYVAGWGRSGSTLLARMLATRPEAVFVGESRDLWQRGGMENRWCSCGQEFYDCPFWTAVGQQAFGGWDTVDFERMMRLRAVTDKPWSFFLTAYPTVSRRYRRLVEEYVSSLERLFTAFHVVSGASTVVDSSKMPSFAMLLRQIPRCDLRVVHLVRDSRGIAHSWDKKRLRLDRPGSTAEMLRYRPTASAFRYDIYNVEAQLLAHYSDTYVRLRYEDLMADPRNQLRRVEQRLGSPLDENAFAFLTEEGKGYAARLATHHAVAANPSRHEQGAIVLLPDQDWRSRMGRPTKLLVTGITAPILHSYGYPLSSSQIRST